MFRIIYPKASKSPQTRNSLIMIGHNSVSSVVLLRQCVNIFVWSVTAYGAAMCEQGVRHTSHRRQELALLWLATAQHTLYSVWKHVDKT